MILCVTNLKGGCGKTATAAAMAQAAAFTGKAVLAIDLDPQMNLSYSLGAAGGPGAYEMLTGTIARRTIQEVDGIDIIAASRSLAAIPGTTGSARLLETAIKSLIARYDLIVIDTPTNGLLQYNGLQAATDMLIPLQAETFSLHGLRQILDTAALIRKTNPGLNVAGIVITMYDGRATLTRQMNEAAQAAAAQLNIPYLGTIRRGIAISEAQALQQNLYSYAPRAKAAQDYMQLYNRLMNGE